MGLLRDVRDADLDRVFEHWWKGAATRALAELSGDVERTRPLPAANARGEEIDETLYRLDA